MAKIAGVQEVDVSILRPYERNAKKHSDDQVAKLVESIREFGFISPCLIDKEMNVIAGHGRIMAAKKAGMKTVPCVFVEGLTEEQRRAYILADNRLTELGDWDMQLVQQELQDLSKLNFDVDLTGFSMDICFESKLDEQDPDEWTEEDAEVPEEPVAKAGEIYQLGKHRLMCGDSTDPDMVAQLMGGEKADMLCTDPPYNVALGYDLTDFDKEKRNKRKDGLVIANDDMDENEFIEFLVKAFVNARESIRAGAAFYIWHASNTEMDFMTALKEAGMKLRQVLIWNKSSFTFGRQDYQWKHEPCLYGWKDGASHYFVDDHTQSTVLDEKRPTSSKEHPTMKPVKLMERLILNSTKPKESVLDLFGGSGTTLMACEELGRKCFMMEYDPHFVDVIINRWETATGQKALLINAPEVSGGGYYRPLRAA